jgi:hypothetical protein
MVLAMLPGAHGGCGAHETDDAVPNAERQATSFNRRTSCRRVARGSRRREFHSCMNVPARIRSTSQNRPDNRIHAVRSSIVLPADSRNAPLDTLRTSDAALEELQKDGSLGGGNLFYAHQRERRDGRSSRSQPDAGSLLHADPILPAQSRRGTPALRRSRGGLGFPDVAP